jgi:leader peptidase (prepilin peptidase)/N-methyltransferase
MIDSLLIQQNTGLFYGAVAILGLIVGSLLNVIIYRLPRMLQAELLADCQRLLHTDMVSERSVNLFFPRSFCPCCQTQLKAWHNIPILSYLFLRGRCATCHQPISLRYPLVEALSCLLSVYAAWHFGFTLSLIFVLLFVWILVVLFLIDVDQQLLPDSLTLSLLWLGLIANTQTLFTTLPNAVLSAAGAYLGLWLFIRLFYLFSGKIGMGNGDFKLFAAFGAWFGWTQLPLILLFASFSGAIIGIAYLTINQKPKDTPIAFGPFLCLAGFVSMFWGHQIIKGYLAHVLH